MQIAVEALPSRLESTRWDTRALPRGVRAGIRAGAKTYRRLGRGVGYSPTLFSRSCVQNSPRRGFASRAYSGYAMRTASWWLPA